MNIYKLSLSGVNVSEGIKRFNNNKGIYEKYLKKFLSDPNFDILRDSILKNDVETAFKAGHTLKGVAANLSISKLYNDICPLVEELRTGSAERAEELFYPVQIDYEELADALTDSL